ncbi:DUF2333 family protein [Pistricoccus aurantiacus]|uniref:DUF2333 family protein n=1 Tax=Pistricoccus aurantiacus TaxID=1883414 RepID=A0A5B8SV89_9GAMM|nr:DUF2333 family protein [Pistricoccus aurantiacus]QEA40321.1 DUF2333 family protein [Pistricoccus aurantiacus]
MPSSYKASRHSKRNTQVLERPDYGWIWKPIVTLAVIYLLVTLALGIWWSRTPDTFDVKRAAAMQQGFEGVENPTPPISVPKARGAVSVATLIASIDTLLEKPGGYLRNDVMPPGLWLDNMPSWELGVLRQTRLMTELLAQNADGEAASLEEAVERLSAGDEEWFYPSTERHLAKAQEALDYYFESMTNKGGDRLAPSDELPASWLNQAAERLDWLSHRLSASVVEREALRDLNIDPQELPEHTPWYRIDNVFFETRGATWAMLVQLRALMADYPQLMQQARIQTDVKRLIAELNFTQRRLWSPLILNGSGFGIFANHSLMMANYTLKARDLAQALAQRITDVQSKEIAESNEKKQPPAQSETPSPAAMQTNKDASKPSSEPSAAKGSEAESSSSTDRETTPETPDDTDKNDDKTRVSPEQAAGQQDTAEP